MSVPLEEPRPPPPQWFSGDSSACCGFLTFELQPSSFPSERAKIAYIITLLSGKALSWATAVWNAQSPFCSSYSEFEEEFKRVFDHPISGREASKRLLSLQQGSRSAAENAIHFRTIAAGSSWNNESLMVCFQNGLSEALQGELATREPTHDLETLIDLAVRLDNRLRERNLSRQSVFTPPVSSLPIEKVPPFQGFPEPMQLGGTRISPSECDRRIREQCCLYCGLPGHFRSACPELSEKRSVPYRQGRTVKGITHIAPPSNSGLFLPITLTWENHKHQLKALVDSGAAGNFMDFSLARSLQIPSDSLATPLTVTALDGRPLGPGRVTLLISLLCLSIRQHQKELCFHLIQSPEFRYPLSPLAFSP